MTDLEPAWAAVHENTPEGWYVGRPDFEERYNQRSMYAFDPSEKPVVGKRSPGLDGGRADGTELRAGDGTVLG